MGKKQRAAPRAEQGFHAADRSASNADARHELYQQAVQAPRGDIAYMLNFYHTYVGPQVPLHLREDFCGTALISATWCRGDVRRSACGVDVDTEALDFGWRRNAQQLLGPAATQLCLVQSNVLDDVRHGAVVSSSAAPGSAAGAGADVVAEADDTGADDLRCRPADIICAFNFSVCLLLTRKDLAQYFGRARAALNAEDGGLLVMDLMGGYSAECTLRMESCNEATGAQYLWEQTHWDPLQRRLTCHISLKAPDGRVLRRIFSYTWRLWTPLEVIESLREAGFARVHVWARKMADTQQAVGFRQQEDTPEESRDFLPYEELCTDAATLAGLAKGWTAYVVAVLAAREPP